MSGKDGTCYLGIDPGKSGGSAAILPGGELALNKWTTTADANRVIRLLADKYQIVARVERVSSSPQQGVCSAFTFGRNYGEWHGLLVGAGIPFDYVAPQRWQKALACLSKGDKNVTKARAQELFPSARRITHAVADALLIAEYCRRCSGEKKVR